MRFAAFVVVAALALAGGGCDWLSPPPLVAEIKPSVFAGKPPLLVRFEAAIASNARPPLSYQWHFGDGQTDLGHPVLHRYASSGTYHVNLIITDAVGNVARASEVVKVVDFSRRSLDGSVGAGAVARADFNSDGRFDLAVANRITGRIDVFLGQPEDGFALARTLGDGRNYSDLHSADFDQDGLPDLVAADLVNSVILVFTGNGRGAFKDPFKAPIFLQNSLVASGPLALTVGDFNGDGLLDVGTANQTTDNVSVLFGDGEGKLTLAHVFEPQRRGKLTQIGAADIDLDGLDDLVLLNQSAQQAEVFLARGDGTFVYHLSVAGGEAPADLLVADLDRDGHVDVALANATSQDVSLWWGNALHRFDSPGRWSAGVRADRIARADLDGDGRDDLVCLSQQAGKVSVLLSRQESRTYERPFEYDLGGALDALLGGDLNGDGQSDLTLSAPDGRLNVLLNLTPRP